MKYPLVQGRNVKRAIYTFVTKFRKIPLRTVLVVPFVLQTVGAVGLVGYLSFKSGQKAVENLANQMMFDVGERIRERLTTYLALPHQVVATNALAVKQGTLNPENFEQLQQHLWQQISLSPLTSSHFFWSEQGDAIGYGRILTEEFRQQIQKLIGKRLQLGELYFMEVRRNNLSQRRYSLVDSQGQSTQLVYSFTDRFQTLPWYTYAKQIGQQTWTPIFIYRAAPTLGMQASVPIYDAGQKIQGIFTSSFSLSDISTFLNQLHFSSTGQTFIIERSGDLIATSTLETLYIKPAKGELKRLPAVNSPNPRTRKIAQELVKQFGSLQALQTLQQLSLTYEQKRQFVRVIPYSDRYGLDWLIVVVVPESDFMGEIQTNVHNTVMLCLGALGLAIALGLFTANHIIQQISHINQASQAMASGNLELHLETNSQVQELQELTQSFNQMAGQIRQSFDRIHIALQKSEDKFTTIFRTSPDPIAILTLSEGRFLEANNRYLKFFDIPQESLTNYTLVELGFWSHLADYHRFRQALQAEGSIDNWEVSICLPSKEIKTVLLSAEICRLEGENYLILVVKDISDRKQAELALEESEQRLQAILDSAPLAIFIKDLEGHYIQVNPAYEALTNLPKKALLGITDYELLPPEFAQISWESDRLVLTKKETVTFEEPVPFPHQTRYLLATKFPLLDMTGCPYAICGIAIDISDRKSAEQALRQSEERFRILFEHAPVAYQSLNEQGRYIDLNSELCLLLGYSREELLDKYFYEFWSPETQAHFSDWFSDFKKQGKIQAELELKRKDGVQIAALLEGRIQLNSQGQFLRTHCILYNITERKRMEQALRQTKNQLRQANRNLEKLVNIDALTQVANRRCFDRHLQQEWKRLRREEKPLALLLIDVDYFKRYNDRYGHQEGDECLIKVAQAVHQVVYRPADLVARYGGEEFAVILPHTNQEGAMAVAERIRLAVQALSIPHRDSEVSQTITISLGIACLIPSGDRFDILVEQADRALYVAKAQGRNRLATALPRVTP